jgi:hypothetical protein
MKQRNHKHPEEYHAGEGLALCSHHRMIEALHKGNPDILGRSATRDLDIEPSVQQRHCKAPPASHRDLCVRKKLPPTKSKTSKQKPENNFSQKPP